MAIVKYEEPVLGAVAWDTETERFAPGYMAPRPVCASFAFGSVNGLVPTHSLFEFYKSIFATCSYGWHIPYDVTCAAAWFPLRAQIVDAFDNYRIIDAMILERLAATYQGLEYQPLSLDAVSQRYGLPALEGKGDVQLSFGPLLGAPIEAYSDIQKIYVVRDSTQLQTTFRRQVKRWVETKKIDLQDVANLTRRSFWLHLMHCRGLRTDPFAISDLRAVTELEIEHFRKVFLSIGFLRNDGSKDTKKIQSAVNTAYEGKPPLTKESNQSKRDKETKQKRGELVKTFCPQVSISRATLEESGDLILEDFAHYGETAAVLNKDLPMLEAGINEPIHTRWGIVSTCRTSSSKPNIQNFRRGSPKKCLKCGNICRGSDKRCKKCGNTDICRCGNPCKPADDFCKKCGSPHVSAFKKLRGIRECIIPRPGYCFVSIDHSGLELCTLAQQIVKMLGLRRMADRINGGFDLHSDVGCLIAKCSYDEFRKRYKEHDELTFSQRNTGKVYQFGRHGGMGAPTLMYYAKQGYGLDLTLEFCQELIDIGARANPDGAEYLKAIRRLYPRDQENRYTVRCWGSNVTRGGCTYSAAANHGFQHLGAMVESAVGWEFSREWMLGTTREGKRSPIIETFPCNYVHDEFVLETPIPLVHDVIERATWIMSEIPKPLLPDVMIRSEAVAMDRLTKDAKLVTNPEGRYDVYHV